MTAVHALFDAPETYKSRHPDVRAWAFNDRRYVRVETKGFVFIGVYKAAAGLLLVPRVLENVEIYKVDRHGLEHFQGYAQGDHLTRLAWVVGTASQYLTQYGPRYAGITVGRR